MELIILVLIIALLLGKFWKAVGIIGIVILIAMILGALLLISQPIG